MTRSRSEQGTSSELGDFRTEFYGTLRGWGDALFELADAALCSSSPVASVPALSLEPVFRRSHGSLYKALERGRIDEERLGRVLVEHRPASWPDSPSWRAGTISGSASWAGPTILGPPHST